MNNVIDFEEYRSQEVMKNFILEQDFLVNLVNEHLDAVVEFVLESNCKDQLEDKVTFAANGLLANCLKFEEKDVVMGLIASGYIKTSSEIIEECIKVIPKVEERYRSYGVDLE